MTIGRSENMRRIRSENTLPELAVREHLRALGHTGYRLHRKELPGKPDIVFVGKRKAILVHGCFWHGHDCKEGTRKPRSNQEYWARKIEDNRLRDESHIAELRRMGWAVLTVWECELRDAEKLRSKLHAFVMGAENMGIGMTP